MYMAVLIGWTTHLWLYSGHSSTEPIIDLVRIFMPNFMRNEGQFNFVDNTL